MPSPFPGMDPWLENPVWFPNLHHLLITAASRALKPQVRDRGYLVTIGERLWVTEPGRSIFPDVALVDRGERKGVLQSGAAVLEADQPIRVTIASSEVRQPFLEILDAKDQHLVTGIEILSPSNKLGRASRAKYRDKQREVLHSRANLVEIDLLRSGRHTVAIPEHSLEPQVQYDYLASLSRAARVGEFEWYPISLRKRLPRILVPLKAAEPDAVLDLQELLNAAYDEGPFADRIDYAEPPYGRMTKHNLAWCHDVLVAQGLRPPTS